MQNQKTPSEIKDSSKLSQPRYPIAVVILAGLCAFSIIGLCFIEATPHYIKITIPPPQDSYGMGWYSTTKSVWNASAISSTLSPKAFIWRQDATLSYENGGNIPSWDSIATYFSEHLLELGWEESDSLISCNIYLPESAFLQPGKNGFLSYRKSSDRAPNNAYEETSEGDVVCLAIWNNKGDSNVFSVVLLTIKQSFFTNLLSVFEL